MGIVYDRVIKEYRKFDVELSSTYFEFDSAGVTYRELLDDYRALQRDINGDEIVFSNDLSIDNDNSIKSGTIHDYDQRASALGNRKVPTGLTVVKALGVIANVLPVHRIREATFHGNELTGGELVDFVF